MWQTLSHTFAAGLHATQIAEIKGEATQGCWNALMSAHAVNAIYKGRTDLSCAGPLHGFDSWAELTGFSVRDLKLA